MDAHAFRTALGRCGYNQANVAVLTDQGFSTTTEFIALPINEVKPMLKALSRMTNHPHEVAFPYQANLKLEGFRHWLEYRSVRGETLTAGTFEGDVIVK